MKVVISFTYFLSPRALARSISGGRRGRRGRLYPSFDGIRAHGILLVALSWGLILTGQQSCPHTRIGESGGMKTETCPFYWIHESTVISHVQFESLFIILDPRPPYPPFSCEHLQNSFIAHSTQVLHTRLHC